MLFVAVANLYSGLNETSARSHSSKNFAAGSIAPGLVFRKRPRFSRRILLSLRHLDFRNHAPTDAGQNGNSILGTLDARNTTIQSLAKAKPERVLKLWEGLGYYTRVRNLQKTAQMLCKKYSGNFPENFDDILAHPPGVTRPAFAHSPLLFILAAENTRMSRNIFSRRKFIASTSALLIANQLPADETKSPATPDENALAINGGKRAVKTRVPKLVRWGEPERQRLNAVAAQDTLFYWKGPQTTALIGKFQQHYPLKYVMPCSSGTAAIHIAMAAAGIAPGDEVITTPISDIGSLIGILFQQAVPVFADVEPHTYNFDPQSVEKLITPKTKAILAVHLLRKSVSHGRTSSPRR